MKIGICCLGVVLLAGACPAAFEKLALMDSLDMAYWTDVETKEGTVKLIEDCLRPNANGILWRDKTGGLPRFASREEPAPYTSEFVIEKRRNLPRWGSHWDLRLDNCGFDVFGFVFAECARRGLAYGIHQTYEECHTSNDNIAQWNLEHPQYWCCMNGGVPWPGHVSLAFPEVMAHKLRFADEHVALKPRKIFIDLWRCGSWSPNAEYVKPNVERWRQLYPGEDLPKWDDPRWTKVVSESMMRYIREYGKRCHAAGVDLVISLPCSNQGACRVDFSKIPDGGALNPDVNAICLWQLFALDYRQLCREGAIDGVWVQDVPRDKKDVWGHLRKVLKRVKDGAAGRKCYFGVDAYNIRNESYASYAKDAGCTPPEAIGRMMTILKELAYDGAVYECVDCHCYDKEACAELKKW